MPRYKKCERIVEELGVARCLAYPQKDVVCPKSRSQYRVTAVCWKVNDACM